MANEKDLLTRSLDSLSWMITDLKYRHDVDMGDVGMIGVGGYSPKLTKAMDLQKELEQHLQGSVNNGREAEAAEIC